MTIDEYISAKVLPEFRPVVAMLRALMRDMAPDSREEISYGVIMFKRNHPLAVISPTKKDITFSFSRGAEFKDRYDLLRGVGTVSKHVKLKSVEAANLPALRYYIKQSLSLDAR